MTKQEEIRGNDYEECVCGDYRFQHKDWQGRCSVPDCGCQKFILTQRKPEIVCGNKCFDNAEHGLRR